MNVAAPEAEKEKTPKKEAAVVNEEYKQPPVAEPAKASILAEKISPIRELFKGDNVLYSNTIKLLDTAESLEDAMEFIHRHFEWDQKNETAQKFISLVYRRHGKYSG